MRYHVFATDYDGTIATDGTVDPSTLEALDRLKTSGRKLILLTGRELGDLLKVFPQTGMFDLVIAENGGLLYRPATREEKVLGPPPPAELVEALKNQNVPGLSVGRVLLASRAP